MKAMKRKLSNVLLFVGCGFIIIACALFLLNQQEQKNAAAASQQVMETIREQKTEIKTETVITVPLEPVIVPESEMKVVEIDGYGYIGSLRIPTLGLELPIMTDWSYPQLKIAPCRYSGNSFSDDLVIMAHNYPKHFGNLGDMRVGDIVTFTDMDNNISRYQVVALDILAATAVEDMTAGEYDLTMFTCTYGGESRITVRCDRIIN